MVIWKLPQPTCTCTQASGEAQYTTDVPTQNGELAAAFVLTSLVSTVFSSDLKSSFY